MPRIRTIDEACAEIKAMDPQSAFSAHRLRCMIKSGEFPAHRAGRRYLVNLDALLEYLENPPTMQQESETGWHENGIRQVM